MLRARLAFITLALGLLFTQSGCFNLLERFQCWRLQHAQGARGAYGTASAAGIPGAADCTCQDVNLPQGAMPGFESAGPVLVGPETGAPGMPPPPTGATPMGPPPRIVPIPDAQRHPWSGKN
jgi:hypothetical protein